jgi:hypothetical protein
MIGTKLMARTLIRTQDGLALILDPALLEDAGIDDETLLEAATDGDVIVIIPVRASKIRENVESALKAVNEVYADIFTRLAK